MGALGDEKKVKVFKRGTEAMQGHLIEGLLTDEKKVREKGIVQLLGEQRDLGRWNMVRTNFRLDDVGDTWVLHAFGCADEERMKIFPWKGYNAQGKWVDEWSICGHADLCLLLKQLVSSSL